ncbi:MAG: 50S ribosomal protein L9 [Epsilonproteobacteria bacterium]|nr:MAG: 50S ribosomal protein L9 [Campylobacterota bacterium]
MKILLIKDVKALGVAGEIKEVKPGYGQNFLIKKGLAKNATTEVIKQFEIEKKLLETKKTQELSDANKFKDMIESSKYTIRHKIGANGHLIGGITNKEVASVLALNDITIDKKNITIKEKIKTVGIYEADCKLGFGVHAIATLDIIEEIK